MVVYNGWIVSIARDRKTFVWGGVAFIFAVVVGAAGVVAAQAPVQNSEFSLTVTPSPLVATVKPGQTTDMELKIRNAGTGVEELKIEPRKFTVDRTTGEVTLEDTTPPDIAQWVSFSAPTFKVKPGEWTTQKIRVALPKQSGFSYSLALIISRTKNPKSVEQGRLIKGSVAVFTLVNVDRPGAVRKLEVTDFNVSQTIYEYLPATFDISFRNTGNTIVQPAGNVFVQRGSADSHPIATLPVNEKRGYLLPDTPRTMNTQWDKGFPIFQTITDADGTQRTDLNWDLSKLMDFRIGPYSAKLVAIYNDGQRDIPIEREVTFWVIPWRTIILLSVVIGLVAFLRHKQIQRRTRRAVQKALEERDKKEDKTNAS